jgi:hypothetical protein
VVPGVDPPRALSPEARAVAGAYQDPKSAAIWEIAAQEGRLVARVNRMSEISLAQVRPMVFAASDTAQELQIEFVLGKRGAMEPRVVEGVGREAGLAFTLEPCVERPLRAEELEAYAGAYHCQELRTTFVVDAVGSGVRLRNQQRHFCSMDLVYEPTIRDGFVAYDPHPGISLITFLRENGRVVAFTYRDPDGDRREDLRFLKLNR